MVSAKARRPDERWTGLTHAGFGHGSLRKIHAAVTSWKRTSVTADVASEIFMWIVSLKKRSNQPFPDGSIARATSPASSETSAKTSSGTSTQRAERLAGRSGGEAANGASALTSQSKRACVPSASATALRLRRFARAARDGRARRGRRRGWAEAG